MSIEGKHLLTARIAISPTFEAQEGIWLTGEGRNGEVHHAAMDVARLSPAFARFIAGEAAARKSDEGACPRPSRLPALVRLLPRGGVIETEPVRRAGIENTVSALGVLQPHRYVDVGAQVSGQVKRIAVTVGRTVKKVDLLLEIDPALQQATVSANRATLGQAGALRALYMQ